jgi:hypothetical protein
VGAPSRCSAPGGARLFGRDIASYAEGRPAAQRYDCGRRHGRHAKTRRSSRLRAAPSPSRTCVRAEYRARWYAGATGAAVSPQYLRASTRSDLAVTKSRLARAGRRPSHRPPPRVRARARPIRAESAVERGCALPKRASAARPSRPPCGVKLQLPGGRPPGRAVGAGLKRTMRRGA